jgi:predicted transcriptional regulator
MTLREIAEALDAQIKTCREAQEREVAGGYASDLLSDVLAHAQKGDLWITLQTHLNIVAVAGMKELAGIIVTGGRSPDEETLKKAAEEKVPVLMTRLPSFEVGGRLYVLGLRGSKG